MSENKIIYDDLKEYESLFTMTPSFVLGTIIKRNSNIVSKFSNQIKSHLEKLNDKQKKQLDIVLNSDVGELQELMEVAFSKTNKKQYKQLASPNAREFIELNLNEIRRLI